ncbi:MAG: hypothetical protein L3K18_07855 [Thermoplasmata archaeon]|nr:hypothetical protein [Thermoplasmata archaeon]
MVPGAPEVEWVPGMSRRWWSAGFISILLGSGFLGDLLGNGFRFPPQSPPPLTDWLASVALAVVVGLPAMLAYLRVVPTIASVGIMDEGLIVDFGRPSSAMPGFRQGYRWAELRRRGRRVLLPEVRPTAPKSLRLGGVQFERLRSKIALG